MSKELGEGRTADKAYRIIWIDAAKGASILLVTLYHAGTFADAVGLRVNIVSGINDLLTPLRMPLFFAAAGLTAGSVLYGGWRTLWIRRLSLYVRVFALWLAITSIFFSFIPHPRHPDVWPTVLDYFRNLLLPNNELWFLWCLALFYVLAWSSIGYKRLLMAFGLSAALIGFIAGELTQYSGQVLPLVMLNALKYFAFFAASATYRLQVMRLVTGAITPTIVMSCSYAIASTLSHFLDGTGLGGLTKMIAASIGVFAVANLLVIITDRLSIIGDSLAWIGQRTLPIYLLQAPLLSLILYAFEPLARWRYDLQSVVPILMVLVFIPVALAFDRVTQKGMTWLVRPPRRATGVKSNTVVSGEVTDP